MVAPDPGRAAQPDQSLHPVGGTKHLSACHFADELRDHHPVAGTAAAGARQ
jgi:hypothetical protein